MESKTYIVAKRNGLYAKSGVNYPTLYRVGANSKKDAVRICRQQLDSTAGYEVKTIDTTTTSPYGLVCEYRHSTQPAEYKYNDPLVIEHNGRLWINTHEERYIKNKALPNTHSLVERHIAIGSRSNNPIECWL